MRPRYEAPPIVRSRIADRLTDLAIAAIATQVGTSADVELALEVVQRAVEIDPGSADRWRVLLQLADLADRRDVASRALAQLVQLDPDDEVARLRRIADAIARKPTAEEQVAVYLALLDPAQRARLGAPVASRLATDLALLLQRTGDLDGYARWLAEAVALDPSNPAAVDELAGFFEHTAGDAAAFVELMVARCVAQPTNLEALDRLGRFLLGHGATAGAARIFDLLVQLRGGIRSADVGFVIQLALARWVSGDPDAALRLIEMRQRDGDEQIRLRLEALRAVREQQRPERDFIEELVAGLPPTWALEFGLIAGEPGEALSLERVRAASAPLQRALAGIRAAIEQLAGSPAAAAATRELVRTIEAHVAVAAAAASEDGRDVDGVALAESILDDAFWLLFLGDDMPSARRVIGVARQFSETPPPNAALVEGWLRLREGRLEEAEAIFDAIAESELRARLGRAVLLLALDAQNAAAAPSPTGGHRLRAAGDLLAVARGSGHLLQGAWAYERLSQLLGARAPLWPDVAEVEAMAATLPAGFDRLLLEPQRELVLTVRPVAQVFAPFERPEAIVTLNNRSSLPLALAIAGPLSPMIAVPLEVTRHGTEDGSGSMPVPLLIDIGRKVALAPRERMEVRVDLGRGTVTEGRTLGALSRDLGLSGTSMVVRGRAILNPAAAERSERENRFLPGLLGSESPPIEFRVSAIPFETGWRDAAIEAVAVVDRPEEIEMLATMTARIAQLSTDRLQALGPDQRQIVLDSANQQVTAVSLALEQLDAAGVAFVALHMAPDRPLLASVEGWLRDQRDPLIRLATMASLVKSPRDPLLAEVRRGDDLGLRRIAELLAERLQAAEAAAER